MLRTVIIIEDIRQLMPHRGNAGALREGSDKATRVRNQLIERRLPITLCTPAFMAKLYERIARFPRRRKGRCLIGRALVQLYRPAGLTRLLACIPGQQQHQARRFKVIANGKALVMIGPLLQVPGSLTKRFPCAPRAGLALMVMPDAKLL